MADIRTSALGGIPFGNNSGRPSPQLGQPYFNGEAQRLELYTSSGWQNIVAETPGVVSTSGTLYEDAGGTLVISGTNFTTGAEVVLIGNDATEYPAISSVVNSIVQITATFGPISGSKEPYDVKVTNTSNLYGLLPDAVAVNDRPIWSTTSGTLQTSYNDASVSIQFSGTDEESDVISYSSSNLPSWLSMSSSGLLTGTTPKVTAQQTYTFNIVASDGHSTMTRSFNIIVNPSSVSGGTLSSDATYYYRAFTSSSSLTVTGSITADVLLVAGGGGGGYDVGMGGGAGGLVEKLNYSIPNGTYAIGIGSGGPGSDTAGVSASTRRGVDSTFGSLLTALGGGGSGSYDSQAAGSGGSGGGGLGGQNTASQAGGAGLQPSSASGGYGNPGGQGTGAAGANNYSGGAGGGGAGGAGGNGSSNWTTSADTVFGCGGIGKEITWAPSSFGDPNFPRWFSGGGGASTDTPTNPSIPGWGLGGKGGGGDGTNRTINNGSQNGYYYIDGKPNTGGGGGGGGNITTTGGYPGNNGNNGGPGGSGICIIRYARNQVSGG